MGRKKTSTGKRKASEPTVVTTPVKKPAPPTGPQAKTKTVPKKIAKSSTTTTSASTKTTTAISSTSPSKTTSTTTTTTTSTLEPPVAAVAESSKELSDLFSDEVKEIFSDLTKKAQEGDKLVQKDFNGMTVKDLKNALKLNDRSMRGKRTELVKDVTDFITNGCPPRCPSCGGGRLRFSSKIGRLQFWCPGYMDDDEFVTCDFTAEKGDIERIPWKNPQ